MRDEWSSLMKLQRINRIHETQSQTLESGMNPEKSSFSGNICELRNLYLNLEIFCRYCTPETFFLRFVQKDLAHVLLLILWIPFAIATSVRPTLNVSWIQLGAHGCL